LPLYLGEVEVDGFEIEFEASYGWRSVRTIFDQVGAGKGADISEMSSSEFISSTMAGTCQHVAIPVFPSRAFRSGYTFVNADRIKRPKDLEGKRIGVPLYTMTAAIMARGHLADEYGVNFDSVEWVQGAMNEAGSHGTPAAPPLLKPMSIVINQFTRSLNDLLVAGEIDAVLGAITPNSFGRDHKIKRLFPDYHNMELQYFRRTRIFPIMHTIVIKRSVHEEHPNLADALFRALNSSKQIALERFTDVDSLQYMIPWLMRDVEEIKTEFDGDPWPYGLASNRPTLEALTRYLYEQGLTAAKASVDDLFLPVQD
jgi:4,5-dihydroxyphthalate decarboxylase